MDISNVTIISKDRLEAGLLVSCKETVTRRLALCGITIDAVMLAPEVISCAKLFGSHTMVVEKASVISVEKLDEVLSGCISRNLPETKKMWEGSTSMGTFPEAPLPMSVLSYRVRINLTGTSILLLNLVDNGAILRGEVKSVTVTEEMICGAFIRAIYVKMLDMNDGSAPIKTANTFDWNAFAFEWMQIRYITDGINCIDMMDSADVLGEELQKYQSSSVRSPHPQRFICFAKIPIGDYLQMVSTRYQNLTFLYADTWPTLTAQSLAMKAPEAKGKEDQFNITEAIFLIPDNAIVNCVIEINMGTTREDIIRVSHDLTSKFTFFRREDGGEASVVNNLNVIRNIAFSGYNA